MGGFLHCCVLETLLVLQGWIPAAFPTPTQAQNESGRVHCAPSFMERDENVLNEDGSSGNFVRSQALKLFILEGSLFLLPSSSFTLEIQVFAVRAGSSASPSPTWPHTDNFHLAPLLSFAFFVCLFQEQEGVSRPCQGLHLAQLALWKYPCAVSSLGGFFSISLNLHVSLSRSDPIPALKSYCDAPAIT